MSDLLTDEIFTDGQQNIAASNMNGIVSRARVQPDMIGNKTASSTMNVADQILVLKTDNTLARARFDTIVNSTSSALPLADSTKNGMLRQLSGNATDFVGGDNNCHPISSIIPPGTVVAYAGPNIPAGWRICDGGAISRTTYASLFAAIGGYYGAGDGSTTFNVPNCVSRFIGWMSSLATTGGASQVALAVGHLPSHAHPITDVAHTHGASAASSDSGHTHGYSTMGAGGTWSPGNGWTLVGGTTGVGYANIATSVSIGASGSNLSTTQPVGSGVAFSILPPWISMYYMIKY
jgi:microcystin-dependent protein